MATRSNSVLYRAGQSAATYLPILRWARHYERGLLSGDLISGLTAGAVMVPVAIAYAQLAGVPPQAGLYSALAGLVIYAIFGTSRHVRVTASSTMAVMSAAVIAPMAAASGVSYAVLTAALALVVGILLVVAGIAHLGFISDFLSKSVVTGFVFGLAITILVGQLPKVFGVPPTSGNVFQQVWGLLQNLSNLNPATLLLSLAALAAILLIKRFFPGIPASLIVLVAGIVIVGVLNLGAVGVSVVGDIPAGLPTIQFPRAGWSNWTLLIAGALGMVFLAVGESLGAARAFAARYKTDLDPDQELIALGTANVSAGLMQGFAIDVSLSQTATADSSGARSQLSGLVSATVILVTILFLAPIFRNLPNGVLAAIVISSVISLMDVEELRRYYASSRTDFVLAMAALIGVITTDVLVGLMFAVILSLLALMYRASRPYIAELGSSETDPGVYGDMRRHRRYQAIPGVIVLRMDAPLYFLNANVAREQILSATAKSTPQAVVLDISASADLDISTTDMLIELVGELGNSGTTLFLAQVRGSVRDRLRKTGVMAVLGEDHVFMTLHSAVTAARMLVEA